MDVTWRNLDRNNTCKAQLWVVDIKKDQEHDGRTISQNGLVQLKGDLLLRSAAEDRSRSRRIVREAANPRDEDG